MVDKLSDHIDVNRQFLRSIRLDADFGRVDAMQGYILQPSAQTVLETTANHLVNTQQRAFTWTGPYGGGKSSLALALASIAGGDAPVRKAARSALAIGAGDGIQKFFGGRKPWAVLPVVGKRTSIIDEIGSAIDSRLRGTRGRKPQTDGRRDVVAELVRAAETRDDVGGVLLIVDELGKFLEYAAQTGEDIGFYQELAEAASRCKGNLVVIGILHQSFEQYASRLGQATQQEWAKVQGRYVDIPLVAGSDEMVSLIGRALQVNLDHQRTSSKVAERVAKVIRKRRPSAASDIKDLLDACWPLHPVTAAMLGPASKKRFGQNERSVFSFLASAEPLGFTEVIRGLDASPASYYWPHQFWDYLRANFEPAIAASPDGHRWAICAEAIERAEARFSCLHVELVKTVGLIEILRNGSGLAAEKDLLVACVNSSDQKSIEQAFNELTSASILIYRKHLEAYGVYAGSDFDIEAAVRDAKTQLGAIDLSRMSDLVDLGPVTARRHYWNTGAMRWFSRNIIHETQVESYLTKFAPRRSQCGEFLLVLAQRDLHVDADARLKMTKKLAKIAQGRGLLVGAPTNADRIEDLVGELAALEYVRKNSQQLDGDDIAMREIASRTQATRSMLSDELREAFHSATWSYAHDGHVRTHTSAEGLSHLASEIADDIFTNSPIVHSELINRDELSSNAAKAQRELLHAMLNNVSQENLGYSSFSADAGLYHTVVRALGLHREKKGAWRFTEPGGNVRSASMAPVWEAARELFANSEDIVSLSDLYKVWQAPPLGVKAGLLPIFALAYFLVNRNHLALYIERMFTPEVTDAHIDEWLQDPKRIGWRFVRIEASEKKMLEALSAALSARLGSPVAPDALDSARALVALVFALPSWARRTTLLSKEAQEVRRVLLTASDPHKVLFADLPLILETRNPNQLAQRIAEVTGELSEVFDLRLRAVEKRMFEALDHQGSAKSLNARGNTVNGVGADFKLEAFATRLSEYKGSLVDIEGLLMLALGKPSRDWNDHDIDAGEVQLLTWAMEFRRLESLAQIRGRPATRRAIGVVFGSKKTVTGTFDVSESDSIAVDALVKELLAKMANGKLKREVFLAAIAEVGATVFEKLGAKQGASHE
ncbi:ATP-binding protein [Noviherbaspirillum saxi]|uniref:ATP-binding protein n=1 Tax=Noviherbaspirillum saxi TaxID=2320863 RepID=A0A3A3FYZ6_9BURK|nr:ATP-binding protein [Noviherbaspirillum saxi]RJF99421.1 ATP-binding protein [Noviherbaspirillum saxi]